MEIGKEGDTKRNSGRKPSPFTTDRHPQSSRDARGSTATKRGLQATETQTKIKQVQNMWVHGIGEYAVP
jgi:hypothetical protein